MIKTFTYSFKNILQVGKSRAVELDNGANKQDSKLEKPEDPNGFVKNPNKKDVSLKAEIRLIGPKDINLIWKDIFL